MASKQLESILTDNHYTTKEVARKLGLAVRSVQLMVDRGELEAWKTPGGHRRISQTSLDSWLERQGNFAVNSPRLVKPSQVPPASTTRPRDTARVLIIEDSVHYQKLISLLIGQKFPDVEHRIAADGIAGLVMAGEWQPDVLIVDILLPGIDGATLITSLKTHPQFERTQLIIVTALDEAQRAPYELAIEGVPVIHKLELVKELPPLLQKCLPTRMAPSRMPLKG
jgi:excisionase family DNA binding protein